MTPITEGQVPSEEQALDSTTPESQGNAGQVTAQAVTPPAPQTDADIQALKVQLQKYEQDIRSIKSATDKRLHEQSQAWQQKEQELRRQNEELKLATLDDDGRAKYLKQLDDQRIAEMQTKVSAADKVQSDYQASLGAIQHFTSLGVPLTELVMDQGYDTLFQSGYKYITENYKKTLAPQQPGIPPLPQRAPDVAVTSGSTPNLQPTWTDLIAKYGSPEEVFRLVEVGRLDPTIIPTS
jgi:hypothetical protein